MSSALLQTDVPGIPCRRGKVRDIYDLGDKLVIVATDRISAFDWVLPIGIPDKGRVLTQLSKFWFNFLSIPNHLISTSMRDLPPAFHPYSEDLSGRTIIVRKADVIPIECVVRRYLVGSGWIEYQKSGTVCGIRLPNGLQQAEKLPADIFTPSTKAESGHDENITFEQMAQITGQELAKQLREKSLAVFKEASDYALTRGIIIADTKVEWGCCGRTVILIDEVLTPDSSRFWPLDGYQVGTSPPSFDKQFARDWLSASSWDKNSPPPALPDEIVAKTREKYLEAYRRLTGLEL